MKRALITTGAAVAGLAWVVTFPVTRHALIASAPPAPDPATADPTTAGSGGGVASPPPAGGAVSGAFLGSDVPNRYGDVQVKVIIVNGHVTDVQAVQLPADRARSEYISRAAGPILHDEVIQAQSAQIDIVSGATYTSESYAQSVASALQSAHLP